MPGASIVLYLPKIQTAEEAALWNDMLSALEEHLNLAVGTIKVYDWWSSSTQRFN